MTTVHGATLCAGNADRCTETIGWIRTLQGDGDEYVQENDTA
jgi:hypothetical protein